jgi:hypothetical protein
MEGPAEQWPLSRVIPNPHHTPRPHAQALATNFRTLTVLQLHACTVPSLGLLPWRSLPSLNHLWLDDARLDLEQLPSLAGEPRASLSDQHVMP